jgi:hypothetical protein
VGQVALLGAIVLAATPFESDEVATDDPVEPVVDAIAPPADPVPVEVDVTAFDRDEWEVDVEEWERLADCESGDWSAEGIPREGTARWDYGLTFDHGDHFQGGLNFHPETWDSYRDPDMPAHAGRAAPWEEIEVAERVLEDQGWNAWPVCSRMMDLAEE